MNILSVLPHLNYKAWFALAEFVDNSIQSSIDHKKELNAVSRNSFKLRVDINFLPEESSITITDNAAGIAESDYQRAFRPAEIPPEASGLSEFGMGMKSAASWFAPTWNVRSSALGENAERTVFFDIEKIVHDSTEELNVTSYPVAADKHYTEIRLENIRRFPKGRTIGKIKEHLASIYRTFLQNGQLELYVDHEVLTYEQPKILHAPHYKDPSGPDIEWKLDVDIDLGDGKSATGFVAIREEGNTRLAGLALFRRNRLVLGSADESYRPEDIFGASTTFAYQRLFGEIHLKGFYVSHTKDGIKWEENEDEFLKKLRELLLSDDLPILLQVRNYSTKRDARANSPTASKALEETAEQFEQKSLDESDFLGIIDGPYATSSVSNPSTLVQAAPMSFANEDYAVTFDFSFRGNPWIVKIELSYADDGSEWLSIKSRPPIDAPDPRRVEIKLAMLHPFMAQFPNLSRDGLFAVLGVAASMALSEVIAVECAQQNPAVIRRCSSEILKKLLSRPIRDE